MTHTEKRSSVWREFLATTISGVMYGCTNTLVGHPLDTIKTKMQAQSEHMTKTSLIDSIKTVYRHEGFVGFYRGWQPNFWGSIIFRSI
jgi:solute carrier family 25 carnitine/acylcarnitine transporter 20/29